MDRVLSRVLALCLTALASSSAHGDLSFCWRFLGEPKASPRLEWVRKTLVNKTLDLMAARKGLPKYLELSKELRDSGRYREAYANFGEMGLAELGISVRYNLASLKGLNTGRPLILVANHHLGIADGLALQYLVSQAREEDPSLLFLARWIEKLMPHAVYGDEYGWGTAVPVEINLPKAADPDFERKMAEVRAFNTAWSRTSLRVLKNGGALILFPAGHVAAMNEGEVYPTSVYDERDSWQDGFLSFARLGKADIVFANVDSVNSEAFYRDRKRFGGGDKERVIWFFSEAIAKKGKALDVYLSRPMSLDEVYDSLSDRFGQPRQTLKDDPKLTAELMRRYTYELPGSQELDVTDSPR